jgi:hypothetical protein
MRAGADASRILLAVLSGAAFLAVSFAPCPPRARAEHAGQVEHPADCEMHAGSATVTAACPCGCADRPPMAGSSARLGAALPSAPPRFEPPSLAAHAPPAALVLEGCFVPAIDHVPLPA